MGLHKPNTLPDMITFPGCQLDKTGFRAVAGLEGKKKDQYFLRGKRFDFHGQNKPSGGYKKLGVNSLKKNPAL